MLISHGLVAEVTLLGCNKSCSPSLNTKDDDSVREAPAQCQRLMVFTNSRGKGKGGK